MKRKVKKKGEKKARRELLSVPFKRLHLKQRVCQGKKDGYAGCVSGPFKNSSLVSVGPGGEVIGQVSSKLIFQVPLPLFLLVLHLLFLQERESRKWAMTVKYVSF